MADRYISCGRYDSGDARWRPFPSGHCQWCGEPLPPRYRTFCPPEDVHPIPGNKYTYKHPKCAIAYGWY